MLLTINLLITWRGKRFLDSLTLCVSISEQVVQNSTLTNRTTHF